MLVLESVLQVYKICEKNNSSKSVGIFITGREANHQKGYGGSVCVMLVALALVSLCIMHCKYLGPLVSGFRTFDS